MGWNEVIKTIKGKQFRYLQRTTRVGTKFKTESKYLGPVVDTPLVPGREDNWSLEKAEKYAERMRGHTVPGQEAQEARDAVDLEKDMDAMEGGRVPQEATAEATPDENAPGGEPGADAGGDKGSSPGG